MSSSSFNLGGSADVIKSKIMMSLGGLNKSGSPASNALYIAPIVTMLLNIFQVCDDIRRCDKECEVVVQKLLDIASLVIRVGQSCEDFGEEDLVHLQVDLQHLQRDLTEIAEVLKECAGSGIWRMFSRADTLLKIKQCDGMLSHSLSMFQTKMAIHIHFTQLSQGREVQTACGVSFLK